MKLKKLLSALLVLTMILSLSVISVGAKEDGETSLLILGDSIALGTNASFCAGELAADFLDYGYTNLAVNGLTTSALLSGIDAAKAQIEGADVIAISIGGNDYLIPFLAIIDKYKGEGETYDDALNKMKGDALNVMAQFNTTVATRTDPAIENIKSIIEKIKAYAPDAKIAVCNLYNPVEALLDKGTAAVMLNAQIKSLVEDFNAKLAEISGIEVLPIYENFTGNVALYTHVPEYDVHPNDAGQIEIASLLVAKTTSKDEKTALRAVLLSRYTDEQISALPETLTNGLDLVRYKGDADNDGAVDSYDASLVLKYDSGALSAARIDLNNTEVSGDGDVDSYDARLILMFDAGLIDQF